MAWPTDDLSDDHFDASTDSPASARPMLETLIGRVKEIIAARGENEGIASLDSDGKVPTSQMNDGVVLLDGNNKIPDDDIPDGIARDSEVEALTEGREVLAWCSFDGGAGTPSSADGYNVDSITDHGTGQYTVTFTTALPNDDYACAGAASGVSGSPDDATIVTFYQGGIGTASVRFSVRTSQNATRDRPYVSIACIGG